MPVLIRGIVGALLVSALLCSCAGVTIAPVLPAEENVSVEQATLSDEYILDVAGDTWTYLSSDWATDNHLPWSWRSEALSGGSYANPAEIGLYALSWLAAYDMDQSWSPEWEETEFEVIAVLDQLRAWQSGSQGEQPNGPNVFDGKVFYQWYWVDWTPPVVGAGEGDHLVPSIDNAWLAASLITIRAYAESHGHSELAIKADAILADMDFTLWYNPVSHRFSWGEVENPATGFEADYYSNENRIINFVARALNQLDTNEFLLSLDALERYPASYEGVRVEDVAWDGSYFTYATPALFIREMETAYGTETILAAADAQIVYAENQGYLAWGFSDCFDVGNGDYVQQGAPPAAMQDPVETRPGLVTPHASALMLITPRDTDAIENLQLISATYECVYEPERGFRDSIMTDPNLSSYGQCSSRFSALAQEWIFLAIANRTTGFVWDYFYRDPGVVLAHGEMFGSNHLYLPTIRQSP